LKKTNKRLPKLLLTEPSFFDKWSLKKLRKYFKVFKGPLSRKQLLASIPQFQVIFIRLKHRLDKAILKKAKNLKIIVTPTTGLNHIDLIHAKKINILVLSLKNKNHFLKTVHATAEFSLCLILALVRNLPQAVWSVQRNSWNRDKFIGSELAGKKLGIIGCGRIGKQVAKYARILGMKVIGFDTKKVPRGITKVSLKSIAKKSDIISLHVNYTKANHHLLEKKFFLNLKKGVFLINTARGELIDDHWLFWSIKKGKISGFATDVLSGEGEPFFNRKRKIFLKSCKKLKNIIITPHIAGATEQSMRKTEKFMTLELVKNLNFLK